MCSCNIMKIKNLNTKGISKICYNITSLSSIKEKEHIKESTIDKGTYKLLTGLCARCKIELLIKIKSFKFVFCLARKHVHFKYVSEIIDYGSFCCLSEMVII